MRNTEAFLLSIKPKYAEAIFSGRKRYELRKLRKSRILPGSLIILYVSSDTRSIIGEFVAGDVIEDTPENVWRTLRQFKRGVGRGAYRYIKDSRRALAIEILNTALYHHPVTLDEIRNIIPGWDPPHSYIKLIREDPLYRLIIRPLRVPN
ncbi:MAG: ASCH domain-containing protein [Desulfurococcales archaeon]|nr:ASCH domain-containing protein [Desulfurococcales archaeon]